MGLGDTDRQARVAVTLDLGEVASRLPLEVDVPGAVHAAGDGEDLLGHRQRPVVERAEGAHLGLRVGDHRVGEGDRAGAAVPEVRGHHRRHTGSPAVLEDEVDLGVVVRGEAVDGHHRGLPEVGDVLEVLVEVG